MSINHLTAGQWLGLAAWTDKDEYFAKIHGIFLIFIWTFCHKGIQLNLFGNYDWFIQQFGGAQLLWR